MTTFNAVCSCLIKHTFNFGCCCLQYGGKNTGSRDCKHKWDYHCSTLCIHTNFCIHINFPQKTRRKRGWDTLSVTLHECPRLRHLEMTRHNGSVNLKGRVICLLSFPWPCPMDTHFVHTFIFPHHLHRPQFLTHSHTHTWPKSMLERIWQNFHSAKCLVLEMIT